jgi:hypothetical protein
MLHRPLSAGRPGRPAARGSVSLVTGLTLLAAPATVRGADPPAGTLGPQRGAFVEWVALRPGASPPGLSRLRRSVSASVSPLYPRCAIGGQPMYACPLCVQPFPLSSVASRELSAEHVPPECFDGRALLLTCIVIREPLGRERRYGGRRCSHAALVSTERPHPIRRAG